MIIIYEPQCAGFEHVEFNAALILSFSHAFLKEKILFLAEEEHLSQVSSKISGMTNMVDFSAVVLPSRRFSSLRKLPWEFLLCRKVFELARNSKTNKVVFSSITSPSLISVKLLLLKFKEIRSIIIPHRILETLVERPSFRRPLEILFWFRIWFPWGNNDRIKYLVLGSSIKEQLGFLFPNLKELLGSIDLPYFYKEQDELPLPNSTGTKIRFASFGVGHRGKGTEFFFKLAEEVQARETRYKPEFIVIGQMIDKTITSDSVKVPSPDAPLSREAFDSYSRDIDYAVFLHKPATYKLVASGALFDAFSYAKPVIALRSPFFEHYFRVMGDIGYLCDNYDEMKELILSLLENKPTERYGCQRKNILLGRKQFTLEKIGEAIAKIWEEDQVSIGRIKDEKSY